MTALSMKWALTCSSHLKSGPINNFDGEERGTMKINARMLVALLGCAALLATAPVANADPIPYPNAGIPAAFTQLNAVATGDITGYFYSSSAGDTDLIEMVDITTGTTSALFFNNQTSHPGDVADFGHVNAGDLIAFVLVDQTTGIDFSSDPTVPFVNSDETNHAYITAFGGPSDPSAGNPGTIPAGTYVGFEDRFNPPSDLDYNDDNFVFTNLVATTTPEPSSIILLGSGLLGIAGLVRRRIGV